MLPLLIAVDHLQPSPPIKSSLHLMRLPFVQIRHRPMDLADQPGLGPLRMTVRVQETTTAVTFATVAVSKNAAWNDSFLATLLATVEGPIHGDPLSQTSGIYAGVTFATPDAIRFTEVTFATPEAIRFTEVTFATPEAIRFKKVILSKANGLRLVHPGDPFLGILVLQGHAPQGIPSLQGEVPLLPKGVVMSRETQPLLNGNTHLELRLRRLLKRDPIRGPLRPILLLLREKTEKLMRPLYQHQLRP